MALFDFIISIIMRNIITSFLFLSLSYFICILRGVLESNSVVRKYSHRNKIRILFKNGSAPLLKSIVDYEKIKIKYLSHYLNNNKFLKMQLEKCASVLRDEKENVSKKTGKKIILMPMHIFSDEFACLIASQATEKRLWCLSNVGNTGWSNNWNSSNCDYDDNFVDNLHLINVFGNKNESKKELYSMMKSFKRGTGECLIFSDVLPEYTAQYLNNNKFTNVRLFEKNALMHSGPFKLPQSLDAVILPYYVHIRLGKLKIVTLPHIEAEDVNLKLPMVVERVLTSNVGNQWMFWHFTSFFYYNG
ncbi:hypothetical protein [Shewanella japonica]|uniref:hypothetical protein n=1 Tax=Shewanella japonica TaxID=93973 RepID=UPI0024945BA2|nr:hypothetical protein [Shewanella japonica]